ncbi:PepSY domain-containing protein [Streptomyces sp. NPDC101393]|uniref:PepSY domain-containing protein n=1 Tax=Streptomyces sp. NPDC101393 TaxID=3366141 RepID=UPI00381C3D0B
MTRSERIGGSNRNKWSGPAGPRTLGMVCAVATAGALLAGCGGDSGSAQEERAVPASPAASAARAASPSGSASPSASFGALTEDQAQRKALIPKIKISYDKALDAALKAVPGTKVVSLDLDDDDNGGDPFWEVRVAKADGTASTVRVDAVSGKAGQPSADTDDDADDKSELAALLKATTVTAQQAAQTALAKQQGTVTAIELDQADDAASASPSSASPSSASPSSASPSSAPPTSASPSPGNENGRNGSGKPEWSVDVVTSGDWNKTTFDIDATNKKILREHIDTD